MRELVASIRRSRLLKCFPALLLLVACGADLPPDLPPLEDPRQLAVRDAAVRAAAYLSSTTEPVGADVVVAMLVYADAADDSYVEARASRRLRLLPEPVMQQFGVALGTDHPVVEASLALVEPSDFPDPDFALPDDRDQLCPLSALECMELPECEEYAGAPLWGYALTHQALQLIFTRWADCAREDEGEGASRIGGRLQAEARFDSAPSDLMSERMAMLGQLGYSDAIEDVWIDELLAAQQEDGSFLWASGDEAGHPHPTGMAIWAFAGWLRSQP